MTVEKPLAIEFGSKADVGLDLLAAGEFAGALQFPAKNLTMVGSVLDCWARQHNALAVTRMNMTDFINSFLAIGLMK